MFLLIQSFALSESNVPSIFTFQYVSINTNYYEWLDITLKDFTFQYVSINTLNGKAEVHDEKNLYIPICFY